MISGASAKRPRSDPYYFGDLFGVFLRETDALSRARLTHKEDEEEGEEEEVGRCAQPSNAMPPTHADAPVSAHALAERRLRAHQARVAAATHPVALTPQRAAAAGGVCFGDALLVARGGGSGGGSSGGPGGSIGGGGGGGDAQPPLLFLAVDALSDANAGVWTWPNADAADQQQPGRRRAPPPPPPPPPRALPVAAAVPPPSDSPGDDDARPPIGTACTALRVLPAARGQSVGDPLRYGDRFALAVVGQEHVARCRCAAAAAAACSNGGGGEEAAAAGRPATSPPPPLLLLTSRLPVAALCPSARAPAGGAGATTQAVAFVDWRPPAAGALPLPPGDAAWVALPADPAERLTREGEPVGPGEPLLLAHAPTRRPLWFGGGAGGVAARWAAAAGSAAAAARHGVELGPAALPANVWRFELG